MSIHTKQELDSFTHSIAALNIQNVTTIQSSMDTLTSQVQNLNSRLNSLASTSTSRSQDFLALLNKTKTDDLKLEIIDSWSKSFQNYTEIQFVLLQSHASSSNQRLDSFEQNYAREGNSTKNRFHTLEQNYASLSREIRTINGNVQEMNQPVALTSCIASSSSYRDGQIITFPDTKTSLGIINLAEVIKTGKFTCEKSGVYLFAIYIAFNGNSNADFELYKNMQIVSRIMIVHGLHGGDFYSGSGTVVVLMTAGDVFFAKAYRDMFVTFPECELGFRSRKGSSCEPCAFHFYGKGCAYKCMCNVTQSKNSFGITLISYDWGGYRKDVHEKQYLSLVVTNKSNIAEAFSSEESVTRVHEEEQNDGLSKTELLIFFCGVLSGIIGLLGFLEISKFVKKRMRMSKSKRDKTETEGGVHTSEEHGTQEALALQESFYETIDDSHLDSVLVPQTCNLNLEKDGNSRSFGGSANYNDDRSSYIEPVSSPITKISSCQREKQSQKTFPSAKTFICIENQNSCSPNLENDSESSSSGSSTNCNDDQSIYLQPLSSFIKKDSSCHTEEHSRKIFPSANKSTCIEDQTSCDPYPAIEEDDSSSEFSEGAAYDRSSYLHPYNSLFNKNSSCHIYETGQNGPFSE
ncbi:C1QL [Mytilus coruscus]|uniref:C1QL n=1 Tax=Mytilus coruscus TaxID=42192 RepID=A0A6J8F171_MYTCO|nr:C1QL [Mytilus coruscus]